MECGRYGTSTLSADAVSHGTDFKTPGYRLLSDFQCATSPNPGPSDYPPLPQPNPNPDVTFRIPSTMKSKLPFISSQLSSLVIYKAVTAYNFSLASGYI